MLTEKFWTEKWEGWKANETESWLDRIIRHSRWQVADGNQQKATKQTKGKRRKPHRHRAAEPQPKPEFAAKEHKEHKEHKAFNHGWARMNTDEHSPNKILAEVSDLDR